MTRVLPDTAAIEGSLVGGVPELVGDVHVWHAAAEMGLTDVGSAGGVP